jgi:tryptophan synthase alpha chain
LRIDDLNGVFASAKEAGRIALIGYLILGFPDAEGFKASAEASFEAGLDILELGFPTQDSFMDGEVISRANAAVRAGGLDARGALGLVGSLAVRGNALLAMMYQDTWLELGGCAAPALLAGAGFAGVINVGTAGSTWEESAAACRGADLAPVGFAGPGIGEEALLRLTAAARGFIYLPSHSGKTGSGGKFDRRLGERIARVKALAPGLPVAVGFGVNTPADVAALRELGADGAIVGTALVAATRDLQGMTDYVASLRAAARGNGR